MLCRYSSECMDRVKSNMVPGVKYRCLHTLNRMVRQDLMRECSKCGQRLLCINVYTEWE